jgi:hypothetical protein
MNECTTEILVVHKNKKPYVYEANYSPPPLFKFLNIEFFIFVFYNMVRC